MLTKCALDLVLAKSIYSKLVEAKPDRSYSFDQIRIEPCGGGDFGSCGLTPFWPSQITTVTKELQSCWQFQTEWDPAQLGEVKITKVDKTMEFSYDFWEEGIGPVVKDTLQRLWPVVKDAKDWRDSWQSLPLHQEA